MDNFKRMFRHNLMMVYLQYNAARVEEDDNGLALYHSPPPIRKLLKRLWITTVIHGCLVGGVTGVW
jgi:hypothetical protein